MINFSPQQQNGTSTVRERHNGGRVLRRWRRKVSSGFYLILKSDLKIMCREWGWSIEDQIAEDMDMEMWETIILRPRSNGVLALYNFLPNRLLSVYVFHQQPFLSFILMHILQL